jgi:hypothetical protein
MKNIRCRLTIEATMQLQANEMLGSR